MHVNTAVRRTSLVAPWLRLCASTAGGTGLFPGQVFTNARGLCLAAANSSYSPAVAQGLLRAVDSFVGSTGSRATGFITAMGPCVPELMLRSLVASPDNDTPRTCQGMQGKGKVLGQRQATATGFRQLLPEPPLGPGGEQ